MQMFLLIRKSPSAGLLQVRGGVHGLCLHWPLSAWPHHSSWLLPTSGYVIQVKLPHRPVCRGEELPEPSSSAWSLQPHVLGLAWCWGSMVPGWSEEREPQDTGDLGWRAGGSEESSSCWGPSGHHLGRTCLTKEPAGSRDGQGGKQENFGHSHATFRHRLLGTPLLKDAALPWRGWGRREGLCFRN